ncbi:MAG: dTDP-4-dehydrorhamnose reductase [Bryobacteraceae bacterium]
MPQRLLILGAQGMLGTQLARLYPEALAWDKGDVDVLDAKRFETQFRAAAPDLDAVVNCIAFNDVDGAEDHPEAAFELNGAFPGRLAALCRELRRPLVHYSTNYVFDGKKGEYFESDSPSPLSVYARSKLRGERTVAAATDDFYLVRTAVLFGPRGCSDVSKRSFVELMMDLAAQRDTIQAVSDEINSVTYAPDLAQATSALLESDAPYGVYHLTNSGAASWYELARAVFELTPRKPQLVAVPASAFPRKAQRPARAVLLNTKTDPLRPWQEALRSFAARHLASPDGPC